MCWIDGIFKPISRRTFVYVYVPGNVSGGKQGDTTQRMDFESHYEKYRRSREDEKRRRSGREMNLIGAYGLKIIIR